MPPPPGHLIHVGYPKAGTHFVQRWFNAHPQIHFAAGGFAGYASIQELADTPFTPDGVRWHVTSCESLVAPLVHASTRSVEERPIAVPGEAQEAVCAKLSLLYPEAHILILTRGFRSVLFSGFSQGVKAGHDAPFSVLQATRDDPDGTGRWAWNYDHLIAHYRAAFEGRVIILPYELLRDDPALFVAELAGRLGIDPLVGRTDRLNESLSSEELAWLPAVSGLIRRLPLPRRARQRLFDAYKKRVGRGGLKALARLLQKASPRPAARPELIADEVVDYFRGRATCLAELPVFDPYRAEYLLDDRF
jgi:hypothetical protein